MEIVQSKNHFIWFLYVKGQKTFFFLDGVECLPYKLYTNSINYMLHFAYFLSDHLLGLRSYKEIAVHNAGFRYFKNKKKILKHAI